MAKEIWVYCESGKNSRVGRELLGHATCLAKIQGSTVVAVLLGHGVESQAAELCAAGADTLRLMDHPALAWPEEWRYAQELCILVEREQPDIFLFGGTSFGRSLAPRVAAKVGTGLTADCTRLDIDAQSGLLRQTRPALGGNLLATILCPKLRPQMATVRPRVFPCPKPDYARSCRVIREVPQGSPSPVRLLERIAGDTAVNIADYEVLVALGQGVASQEHRAMARTLAEELGGTLAATRPLVDAGLMPYARQVGQTGKTVAPKLYLALGISGAIQHLAGVAAEKMVAVNIDPDAPIFACATYGLVMDCGRFLEEAIELVKKEGIAT